MTSRQRLLTALRRGRPDRVPVGPFTLGALDPESDVAKELIRVTDPFISVGGGADPVWGENAPVERFTEGNATVSVCHTPTGDLRSVRRRTAKTSATVEFWCKRYDDAEKWLSLPYHPPEPDLTEFSRWKERIGEEGLVMVGMGDGVCLPAELFSPAGFSLLWADEPDLMRRLVRVAADRYNVWVEKLCEAGVDAFRIVGGEYVSVQLGPAAFEELVVGPDGELCEIMRKHGAISYFHNHGPVTRYYGQFLRIGMDALDPLEAPPWGDCDLAEAKRRIGRDVCMVGNLDDMEVLDKLPWNEIEPIAAERLAAAGPDAFVLGGTASGTYSERGARMFMNLVPLAEAMASRWS